MNNDKQPAPTDRRLYLKKPPEPTCLRCGSSALKITRSIADQGDGSRLQYVRCQVEGCRLAFQIIWE